MIHDPTAEIKRIRHQLGADDNFDLDRIFSRLRQLHADSGRTYVRRAHRKPAGNHPMQPSGEVRRFEVENQPSPPADR